MQDICARELKGHDILDIKRFQDDTRYMVEFIVRKESCHFGKTGDEIRLFLTEAEYRKVLECHMRKEIKVKRYALIVEGHILYKNFKKEGLTYVF